MGPNGAAGHGKIAFGWDSEIPEQGLAMNLSLLIPEATVVGVLLALLFGEMATSDFSKKVAPRLSFWGAGLVIIATLPLWGWMDAAFGGMFILDKTAVFFKIFFALILMALIPMSQTFLESRCLRAGEFYLILMSALLALFFLVSANDFLLLFISLEMFTLSLYILAAYAKHDLLSIEAGLKYLILGSLASALLFYGISLLYLGSGTLQFADFRVAFQEDPKNKLLLLGMLFVLSGLGFKVASVPFQLWVPDVYQGAPTPVVALLSVGSKAAGFAILLRLLFTVFVPFESGRVILFSGLAAMTLLYGNLAAIRQSNIKRLFGYSSIGHTGYMLMGLAAGGTFGGTEALFYYLMAYAAANLAAFYVIHEVGTRTASDEISTYRGLAHRSPFLAGVFFTALLSLAGVPPLGGFFGKFLILLGTVKAGLSWLALLGALGVAVSLYYYLMVVRMMFIEEPAREEKMVLSSSSKCVLILLLVLIFALGLWQSPFLVLARSAAGSLS